MRIPFKSLVAALYLGASCTAWAADTSLLNVSYDPTREFYNEYNALFIKHWKGKTSQSITVKQSHGGSAKQARSVMEGLPADIVTLALAYDIDAIAKRTKKLPENWQTLHPHNSAPYTSIVVLLVRKGNPKQVKGWDDLVRDGLQVITANPKTSGGARWNYLVIWGHALEQAGGDESKALEFMKRMFKNVPILDSGARGATTTFTERGIGDVLVTWENEALLMVHKEQKEGFDIIIPSQSIRAEPPVAVIEANAKAKGTLEAANEYVQYLYSPEAQEVIARHYFRPTDKDLAARHIKDFPDTRLLTIADFGGWDAAQQKHFAEGGTFDQIYIK